MFQQIATGTLFLLVFGGLTALFIYCARPVRALRSNEMTTQIGEYVPPLRSDSPRVPSPPVQALLTSPVSPKTPSECPLSFGILSSLIAESPETKNENPSPSPSYARTPPKEEPRSFNLRM